MVVIYVADNFTFLEQQFKKGDVLTMPMIQAYAMQQNNRNIVAEKTAWTAVDGVLLVIGVGEMKILFTAGNYLQKTIVLADMVGATAGTLGNVLNESALSPETRYNLQMLAIVASLPQMMTSIKKIDDLVKLVDDEINTLNNVAHKTELSSYFSSVKSRLALTGDLDNFLNKLKERGIFNYYESLSDTPALQQLFVGDFMNASEDVLDSLKNPDAYNFWKTFRNNRPNVQLCN